MKLRSVCLRAAERKRWIEGRPADVPDDDAPAWCLKDLTPRFGEKTLSFYRLPSAQAGELAPVVASALAAMRQELGDQEYMLFDEDLLSRAGLAPSDTLGETPHTEVNTWHIDVPATSRQVALLASILCGRVGLGRVLEPEVRRQLRDAHQAGKLQIERIKSKRVLDALK